MLKFYRGPAPQWLKHGWKKWGLAWEARLVKNSRAKFNWPTVKKQKSNHLLLQILSKQTQNHCSFCDAYPMKGRLKPTIEHFRPKSKFPKLVMAWSNLFLCCYYCQEKGDRFNINLLKPDARKYRFKDYFMVNFTNGLIEVRPGIASKAAKRAKTTIEIYKWNKNGKPEDRLAVLEEWKMSTSRVRDRFSYRFMLYAP